jgi:cytochrome c nitrite reductase small subunit
MPKLLTFSESSSVRWGLLISILIGGFLGQGLYAFYYGKGLSYFSKEPAACANCHIMQPQFDSWQKASHHTVATCVDCHLPHHFIMKWLAKAENGYQHSKKFTLQNYHEPIFIRDSNQNILNQNCLYCHSELVHDMLIGATTKTPDRRCVHCHRSVGHGAMVGGDF